MTNEEIKKALEFCAKDDYDSCGVCSYDDVRNCNYKLKTDARELIIKQEQEIARLKSEYEKLQTNAEILARGVRDLNHENYKLTEKIKQAKTDVLNELEAHIQNAIDAYWDSDGARGYCHADNVIVDIEEMIEELKK